MWEWEKKEEERWVGGDGRGKQSSYFKWLIQLAKMQEKKQKIKSIKGFFPEGLE